MKAVSARSAITSLHHPVAHVLLGLAVLARALGRQQDLLHDALAGEGAVGVGQLHLPAAQVMPLGPGLAVGRSARTDGVQDGDKAVGVLSRRG